MFKEIIRTANIRCTVCGCDEIVEDEKRSIRSIICNGCGTVLFTKYKKLMNGQMVTNQPMQTIQPQTTPAPQSNFRPAPVDNVVRRSPKSLKPNELPLFGARIFYNAIFNNQEEVQIGNRIYKRKLFVNGSVPGFDTENFRYIAQNTNKNSVFAEKARSGHKIMWVFMKNTPIDSNGQQESGYLLRVEDGQIYDVREKPILIGSI